MKKKYLVQLLSMLALFLGITGLVQADDQDDMDAHKGLEWLVQADNLDDLTTLRKWPKKLNPSKWKV